MALEWMTMEIQAAIEGAQKAGADEIIVAESHHVVLDRLDKNMKYVLASRFSPSYLSGLDKSVDAVLMIGKHARAGVERGVLNHTGNTWVQHQWLNGIEMGETGFEMVYAGTLGIPVVFISGDKEAVWEAKALVKNMETIAVKAGISRYKAISLHPCKAQELIRAGVERALERREEIKPYIMKPPYKWCVEFTDTQYASNMNLIPGVQKINDQTIMYKSRKFQDIVKVMLLKGFLYSKE